MDTQKTRTLWVMRHGKPDLAQNPILMTRSQFNDYLKAYDEAGIREEERIRLQRRPLPLPDPYWVLSSDLPRARETALMLAPPERVVVNPVLREIPVWLPEDDTPFLRGTWPAEFWWTYLRYRWFRGAGPEGRPLTERRAEEAAEFIRSRHEPGHSLVVVSHAGFLLVLIRLLHRRQAISGRRFPHIAFARPTRYDWRS